MTILNDERLAATGHDFLHRPLAEVDPEIAQAIETETRRQNDTVELIASENHVSKAVLTAMGSVFTNKYAEGYPGKRYYGGCGPTDVVETIAIQRAKELFGAEHANVQPHSGSQANMSVYFAMLKPGDTIMGMDLSHGGHLTHGHPLSYSGRDFKVVAYGVRKEDELIDYDEMQRIAEEAQPRMIICGASAYSRVIDFKRIREIADGVGALMMADIAHIAGLVVTGHHPSPVPYADFVTTTTHKTLRGPRAGLVLCKEKYAKDLDRSVFPGVQGGPLVHIVAAKAVALKEALSAEFKEYQGQVARNAKTLAQAVANTGFRIVSGGTDNHLFMTDVFSKGITGKDGQNMLEAANITVNKNTIPFDQNKPMVASGIRIGTPAVTTRGMREADMQTLATLIARVLDAKGDAGVIAEVKHDVKELCDRFPIY
ncbi:MAG: serine hydroxymethyltransferase [Acidobacteria bacterium]|nr:serine hydroxymethyltransferase [Acidobacteriota bacterium]MBV9478330.1 serine hydroxymethyltransferase [Acidobacteriota bacterium]